MRRGLRALLLALLLLPVSAPGALGQEHDDHDHEHEEAPAPTGRDPWAGIDTSGNATSIPRLKFQKGDYFVYHNIFGEDSVTPETYTVLDVRTMEVQGREREVILYGWDHQDPAKGLRDAYIEYRDAATFDLIKLEKFGHSKTKDGEVSRRSVTTWSPPYREAPFPIEVGRAWRNDVVVTKDESFSYPHPQQGIVNTTLPTDTYLIRNEGVVSRVVNLTVAGRNVSTLQATLLDSGGSNRTDRYNWHPEIPVPVRIVRYRLESDGTITVLNTLRLVNWVMGDLPQVRPAAVPAVAHVNEPVTLLGYGTDPGRRIQGYGWSFGDPSAGANNTFAATLRGNEALRPGEAIPPVTHTWTRPGTYTVKLALYVTPNLVVNETLEVTILNEAPTAVVAPFEDAAPGEALLLDGTLSTDREGPIADFLWTFEDDVVLQGPLVSREFTAARTRGTLTVTDRVGATGVAHFIVDLAADRPAGTPRTQP
ncbi:MAG TPA: PKD domain-containing protein, partial [Candidatus Thermoplasmatota archaeon]|nr:PKD domain-containing protein [Candidatus Thermoplasmatota archaeon]